VGSDLVAQLPVGLGLPVQDVAVGDLSAVLVVVLHRLEEAFGHPVGLWGRRPARTWLSSGYESTNKPNRLLLNAGRCR
jgi:hypothetical protein